MPRAPRGKRIRTPDGTVSVAAKNPNGDGSVYYEAPAVGPDGKQLAGRWRATYRDQRGRRKTVSAATRAKAEERRDHLVAQIAAAVPSSSRFSKDTTVS